LRHDAKERNCRSFGLRVLFDLEHFSPKLALGLDPRVETGSTQKMRHRKEPLTQDIGAMVHHAIRMLTATAGLALLCVSGTSARADVIDGDWCHADGKRMSIHGPEIMTPGGKQTRGDYARHSFVYVIPAGEAGSGETVSIILRSEYFAQSRQGGDTAPWQDWKRCSATTS
jgi:hypothetical protein